MKMRKSRLSQKKQSRLREIIFVATEDEAAFSGEIEIEIDESYSDCRRGYNVQDVSEFKHYRINYSKLFANKRNYINGIESFWNQAKRHMRKFNGILAKYFPLGFAGV